MKERGREGKIEGGERGEKEGREGKVKEGREGGREEGRKKFHLRAQITGIHQFEIKSHNTRAYPSIFSFLSLRTSITKSFNVLSD